MEERLRYAQGHIIEPYKVSFYDTDTEELYNENKATRQDELDANEWNELDNGEYPDGMDSISLAYRFNSCGFRGVEFPTTRTPRTIITLGDSTTFGIGMPEGLIWPTIIGNTLRQRAINLALPGGNTDMAFQYLLAWLPIINSKHVFLLEPIGDHIIAPTDMNVWILHREKNIRAIESVCNQFGAQFTMLDNRWQDTANSDKWFNPITNKPSVGRDLLHPGRTQHRLIAYLLMKKAGIHSE